MDDFVFKTQQERRSVTCLYDTGSLVPFSLQRKDVRVSGSGVTVRGVSYHWRRDLM